MSLVDLKKATCKTLGITRQAVESRAKRINKDFGPFSNEIVYGIVAQQASVNVSKFIEDEDIMQKIRDECDRIQELKSTDKKPKNKTKYVTRTVNIGKEFTLTDPIISPNVITEAKAMTEIYAKIYIFENSIREVINLILQKNLGDDWWNSKNVTKDLRQEVQGRMDKEVENPWHGKRGAHQIYYTDINDLAYLIRRHWKFFSDIFPRLEWVTEKIEQISLSRNVVNHHNPLKKDDIARLSIYFNDWQKQIAGKKDKIK